MALVSVCFTACRSDDDESSVILTDADVVGTWVTPDGEYPTSYDSRKTVTGVWSYSFYADRAYKGRLIEQNGTVLRSYSGHYTYAGNKITGTSGKVTETFTFQSLNGNKATVVYSAEGYSFTFQCTKYQNE